MIGTAVLQHRAPPLEQLLRHVNQLSLQEEGHVTLRMMARPGRIRGVGSIFGVLRNVLPGDTADTVGKIRLLTGQPEGDGASHWEGPRLCCCAYHRSCSQSAPAEL